MHLAARLQSGQALTLTAMDVRRNALRMAAAGSIAIPCEKRNQAPAKFDIMLLHQLVELGCKVWRGHPPLVHNWRAHDHLSAHTGQGVQSEGIPSCVHARNVNLITELRLRVARLRATLR